VRERYSRKILLCDSHESRHYALLRPYHGHARDHAENDRGHGGVEQPSRRRAFEITKLKLEEEAEDVKIGKKNECDDGLTLSSD
jgi:hypothetical protein